MNTTSKNQIACHFNGIKTFTGRVLHNESGIALVTAMLFMVMLVALVPAAMQLTSGEFNRTGTFKESREAFFVAEAGLEHAKALTEEISLREALSGPDGFVNATASDPQNDDNGTFSAGTQTPYAGEEHNKLTLSGNTYYIRAFDNNDGNGDQMIDSR